jgi:hypothetical protein
MRRLTLPVPRLPLLGAAVILGAAGLATTLPALPASAASGACTTSGDQVTCTFTVTGAAQSWTPPAGVSAATVILDGASGGAGAGISFSPHEPGGNGATVTATIPVMAGEAYQVLVGGAAPGDGNESGGFNGGGTGGSGGKGNVGFVAGGGGGASTFALGSAVLAVAGGGGGGGGNGFGTGPGGGGGPGGGPGGPSAGAGSAGGTNSAGGGGGGGGQPGTAAAGGQGGSGGAAGFFKLGIGQAGTAGASGTGGSGGTNFGGGDGGGGGGGYFGGGGGGSGGANVETVVGGGGGGGGGGSDFVTSSATAATVTDGTWSGNGQVIISYTVSPLKVTTASLPGGQVGTAYGPATLAATGGVAPYSWSVSSGSLPPGLSLSTAGVISGTPTAYGMFDFTVTVTDAESPAMTASAALSIVVKPAPLVITTTSLPAATGGQPYSATLAATGGVTPYTWSVTAGALPPGLALNASTGVISGTPDVAGTYSFTVTVTDAESPAMTASAALSISVSGPVITSLRPDSGPTYGDTPVIISGTGLSCPAGAPGCRVSVTFGGKPALVEFVGPGEIGVVDPAGSGTVAVTVTVGGVSSQATTVTQFTYVSPVFLGFRV